MNLADWTSVMAEKYRIPVETAVAIGKVESGMRLATVSSHSGQEWLWDVQKNWAFRDKEGDFCDNFPGTEDIIAQNPRCKPTDGVTERVLQRLSWGPFGLYGALARKVGYLGPFAELCSDPEAACRWSFCALSSLHGKYFERHGWAGVLCAYRYGRPRVIDEVYTGLPYLDHLRKAGAKYL